MIKSRLHGRKTGKLFHFENERRDGLENEITNICDRTTNMSVMLVIKGMPSIC